MRSEKPIIMRTTPSLRSFPSVAFETVPMFVWLTMVLSRPFKELFLFLRLSPPGQQRCHVFGFVPASRVSSFSTLQIFRETSHLRRLLCSTVYLLGHFPSLRHVQGSTPTGYSERGCRLSIHSSLGFPFRFSLEVFAQIKQKTFWSYMTLSLGCLNQTGAFDCVTLALLCTIHVHAQTKPVLPVPV